MRNRIVAILALCAVTFTLTGCIGHAARGIGHSYSTISGAKDRDHALTHASSEDTIIRQKKEGYLDRLTQCLDQHGGRMEHCQSYKDIVDHYDRITADRRMASTGMDPAVESVVYEYLAIGRWEDWGQNAAINRNRRDIDMNAARIGILEDEADYIWNSLDRIEQEYREWDDVIDEAHMAEIDAIIDELDDLYDFINYVDGGATFEAQEMQRRISRLEQEIRALRGTKGVK
ncbi:hypothetical protein HOI83_00390 [Candidatus Uhrbacteria bacterium]|nr:hypothetical protein [Candidatus Uhrbacteria bacterium]